MQPLFDNKLRAVTWQSWPSCADACSTATAIVSAMS